MKITWDMKWKVVSRGIETSYWPSRDDAREIAQMLKDFGRKAKVSRT